MTKLTFTEAYNIKKHYYLEEGIADIKPELLDPNINPSVVFACEQLKFHREWLEKWIEENVEYEAV